LFVAENDVTDRQGAQPRGARQRSSRREWVRGDVGIGEVKEREVQLV
jgi:hypothetical protein